MSTTVSITLSREALQAAIAQQELVLAAYKTALQELGGGKKKASAAPAAAPVAAASDSESETSSRKPNKSKGVKRGSSGWNLFTAHVRVEMIAASPDPKAKGPKVPEVTAEAKRRKEAGEYDEAHWKALALAKKESANSSDAEAPETPAKPTKPAKTEAPKKAEAPAAAAKLREPYRPSLLPPKPSAPLKKAVVPPPPADDEDDEAEVSEWTFNGNKMFKSSDNEVWANKGGMPGVFLGIYDPLTNRINSYDNEKDEDDE